MLAIRHHRLAGTEFQQARSMGPEITPEIVIIHDTAGRLDKGNSARYLADNDAGVSVHFVVERDGKVTQQVPVNRKANHAGRSSYHGRDWCNDFSIGVEIVNAGKLIHVGDQPLRARAWWKQTFVDGEGCELVAMATPEHGAGVWMDYTAEQIASVTLLLEILFRDIKTLRDITTHWYVSPGRKVDTNPLFPLEQVRAKVLGRDDPADEAAEDQSVQADPSGLVDINVPGGTLNMRRWPSFNPNIIASIPGGITVPVLREGVFAGRRWLLVSYGGHEGWVVASYTVPTVQSF